MKSKNEVVIFGYVVKYAITDDDVIELNVQYKKDENLSIDEKSQLIQKMIVYLANEGFLLR